MSFSPIDCSFKLVRVEVTSTTLDLVLDDGRVIPVLRSKYRNLASATDLQLAKWHIDRLGIGIHWDELDEDLLIYPLLEEAQKSGQLRFVDAS